MLKGDAYHVLLYLFGAACGLFFGHADVSRRRLAQHHLTQPNAVLVDESDQVGLVEGILIGDLEKLLEPHDPLDLRVLDAVLLEIRQPLLAGGFFLGVGHDDTPGQGVEAEGAYVLGAGAFLVILSRESRGQGIQFEGFAARQIAQGPVYRRVAGHNELEG